MTVKYVRSLFPAMEKMWVENISQTGNRCPIRDKISVEYPVPNETAHSRSIVFSTHIMSLTGQNYLQKHSVIQHLMFLFHFMGYDLGLFL